MNRTQRLNQMRQERENGGLQQVLQMPGLGATQTLRKTTYTRTELLQRGSTATTQNRNKRGGGTLSNNINRLPSVTPVIAGDVATVARRPCSPRGPFLPRVAKLASNTNNNVVRVNNRDKSPVGKKLKNCAYVCDNESSLLSLQPVQKLPQLLAAQTTSIACGNSCSLSSSSSISNCNCNSNSNSSYEQRKMKLAQAFRLPDEQNKSFVYLCKPVKQVQELLTVQPLCNSNENMSKLGADDYDQSDRVSCSSSLNSQQQLTLDGLEDRPLLIQRAQSARAQLETTSAMEPEQQLQSTPGGAQNQVKIDLVCQNIPTLQREIRLLQQLGEKLEATLRANTQTTSTAKIQTDTHVDGSSIFYTPRSTLAPIHGALPIVHWGWRRVERIPRTTQRARIISMVRYFGTIEEFRIETKTLTELKTADETQCFYLPMSEDGGLQLTSFRKLRENPNVLLQQLRPLTPARPFNLLEQDAMFFNSMLSYVDTQQPTLESLLPRESGGGAVGNQSPLGALSTPYTRLTVRVPSIKEEPNWLASDVERLLLPAIRDCQNVAFPQKEPLSLPSIKDSTNSSVSKLSNSKNRTMLLCKRPKIKPIHAPIKLPRRSNSRAVAPLKPQTVELEPRMQTQLLKTVLVGIVQVALFLVLIMAFTYPDIRC